MIKGVLVAVLLVLSPLAQAEILFQDEDVWDAFVGQDFDANLVKAEEGDARAQYLIGRAYLFGLEEQGVNVDQEKGLCWMKAAADQGAAEAYYALGVLYRRGIGVDKDAGKWEEYMIEAGEQWLRPAMTGLLDTYRDGDPQVGIDQDEEKYLYWLEKTAEDGLPISMRNMARRYREGRGFEVDYEKAFEWIIRAVEQDDSLAQAYAGEFFEQGLGTEQDFVKAYMMYDLSTGIGREAKYELADKMTEEQIEEAIARSWQWQLKHGVVRPSSGGYRYQPDVIGLEPLSLTPESDQ
ncbi:tetratricopeptide repeat protein [Halomonas mongoliensis]|uniref:Tetratricopeptide repeat protein n=1 Tax=Halomonas mongoliensis TaxID=321265 RepID=A0ABU1GS56_9GAMM|nr:tetratricopeptide repeat protein [Halomonas mongoliensis]MDR5894342.1 tetratricopeptide repeat protein [Halomonas mongoliensis]